MTIWSSVLRRYRVRKSYRETCRELRNLDVHARADVGVVWLEISDVAWRAVLRAGV